MRHLIALFALYLALPVQANPLLQLAQTGPAAASGGIADDFNRADSTNMGANWSEIAGDTSIASNKFAPNAANNCVAIWSTQTVGVSQWVAATLSWTSGADYPFLVFRCNAGYTARYIVELDYSNQDIKWHDASGLVEENNLTTVSGDRIGVTVDGTGTSTVVRVWHNPTGSPSSATNWNGDETPDFTFVNNPASASDANLYIGLGIYRSANTARWDDFSGGSF